MVVVTAAASTVVVVIVLLVFNCGGKGIDDLAAETRSIKAGIEAIIC